MNKWINSPLSCITSNMGRLRDSLSARLALTHGPRTSQEQPSLLAPSWVPNVPHQGATYLPPRSDYNGISVFMCLQGKALFTFKVKIQVPIYMLDGKAITQNVGLFPPIIFVISPKL